MRSRAPLVMLLLALPASSCARPTISRIPPPSPALSDDEIERRIAFIEERLEASRRHALLWHWGWMGADTAGVAIGVKDGTAADGRDERAAGVVNAVLGAGGYVYQVLDPMNARYGAGPLRELPRDTHPQKLQRLERAQQTLYENAERAATQLDWVYHLGNLVVALAAGGIIWGVGDEPETAAITAGPALVGGELQFWSEPARPRRDLDDYLRMISATPEKGGGIGQAGSTRTAWTGRR